MQSYLRLLISEIHLAGELIGYKPRVSHIHFGGGTPNILSPKDLQDVLDAVSKNFKGLDQAEIAMEIDPRLLSEEKVNGYTALGLNRVSLGVQDFQNNVQRAMNRIQPYETIERCMEWLRNAGIKNINFDLMYGLPLQTVEGIEDNIDKALSLSPDRIALFGYAHVPWMKPHQKLLEKYELPDSAARFEQQKRAQNRIIENGYQAIGMDHFSLPDDALCTAHRDKSLRRNFQGYTTDNSDVVLGFGLSAISSFPQAYIQNTSDITVYKDRLTKGALATVKGCILSEDDKMRRDIIQNLMCNFEADLGAICRKYRMDTDILAQALDGLKDMIEDFLVAMNGYHLKVTEKGRPFVRIACMHFDSYITAQNENAARHSKAV